MLSIALALPSPKNQHPYIISDQTYVLPNPHQTTPIRNVVEYDVLSQPLHPPSSPEGSSGFGKKGNRFNLRSVDRKIDAMGFFLWRGKGAAP